MHIYNENSLDLLSLQDTPFEQFGTYIKDLIVDNDLEKMTEGQTITLARLDTTITCTRISQQESEQFTTEHRILRLSSTATHTLGVAEDLYVKLETTFENTNKTVMNRKALFIEKWEDYISTNSLSFSIH